MGEACKPGGDELVLMRKEAQMLTQLGTGPGAGDCPRCARFTGLSKPPTTIIEFSHGLLNNVTLVYGVLTLIVLPALYTVFESRAAEARTQGEA